MVPIMKSLTYTQQTGGRDSGRVNLRPPMLQIPPNKLDAEIVHRRETRSNTRSGIISGGGDDRNSIGSRLRYDAGCLMLPSQI
jgi:hypothetical protein